MSYTNPCRNYDSLVETCDEQLIKNKTKNLGLVVYSALKRSIVPVLTDYLYSESEEDLAKKNYLRHFLFLCEKKIDESRLMNQT
ncbi:MAG: hypothetical protein R6V40_03615 [Candidatus Moraniibacteriota bacterium]